MMAYADRQGVGGRQRVRLGKMERIGSYFGIRRRGRVTTA